MALGVEKHRAQVAEICSKLTRITPRTLSTVFTRWSPVPACPELQMAFAEAKASRRPKGVQGHKMASYVSQSVRERTEVRWIKAHPELDKHKSG